MSLPLLLQFGAYETNNLAGVMMAYDGLPGLSGQWGKISRHWLPPFNWGVYYKGKESSSGEDDVWLGGIKWELLTVPPCKVLKCSLRPVVEQCRHGLLCCAVSFRTPYSKCSSVEPAFSPWVMVTLLQRGLPSNNLIWVPMAGTLAIWPLGLLPE